MPRNIREYDSIFSVRWYRWQTAAFAKLCAKLKKNRAEVVRLLVTEALAARGFKVPSAEKDTDET
jgi:hypothetical protein